MTTIQTQSVQVQNGDLAIEAYLAMPQGEGIYPAVIVIQEVFGVNEHIKDVTERFAQAGYIAIAPAIYQRLAPGFAVGYTPEGLAQGREYKEQTKASELLSDLQSTLHYLHSLPQVKPGGVGCIGFCFGGHVAYLAATLPGIQATASFYGAGIATLTPGGGEPTLRRTSEIQGTLYAFFGEEDPLIPLEQVEQIEAELQKQQISHQIFRYAGAGHGFFCDQRPDYREAAAQDAWQKVLQLFSSTL
ncbi:dienelactone hydrolase family protein [Spirulina subsalsa FACHB-351]|uniref:Dienelactone hydrolase family protein n=1 Tax=Spirulina subsalsa FACHB-351 TaxID=234711 RepID=A0ABT3L242_9CYAN|nr:dienelactone hydrolase family protein [Spirulina subsalsa]MCW6035554.1 dienelactone hydrolase family protein [Spirulina subsalsa FACHB-351]